MLTRCGALLPSGGASTTPHSLHINITCLIPNEARNIGGINAEKKGVKIKTTQGLAKVLIMHLDKMLHG
ncbi:hypothetical protein O3P69_014076 [Scylla paramamosain]|uniref:Uncharacterized protein n=1 Tax=Scylla paramamosain TaxID=85552 RepID=A0AAW0ST78_SCYPA